MTPLWEEGRSGKREKGERGSLYFLPPGTLGLPRVRKPQGKNGGGKGKIFLCEESCVEKKGSTTRRGKGREGKGADSMSAATARVVGEKGYGEEKGVSEAFETREGSGGGLMSERGRGKEEGTGSYTVRC